MPTKTTRGRKPLTPREAEALAALRTLAKRKGEPPTREELFAELCLVGSGNTHRIVYGLVHKGYVRNTRRQRGLQVVGRA